MEYKLILSGPVNKRTVENAVIDWVRKHPQGVMATSGSRGLPSQAMPVPQNRQQQAPAHSPAMAPQRTQPRVYGPPAPAGLEQALSSHIRMRRVSEMGKGQVHTFIYNERELLIVRQGNLHHQWVQLKHSWETTQGLQAVQAVQPKPANLSEWDRLKLAMASGIRQLPGQVVETVQKIIDSLLTWQGMLLIVAVTAIFVLGGEIALILMGAVAVYDLLMNVLPLLVEFYHKAIAAKDQAEIDAAGKLFAQAILRGGLDVIDILFAGGAVRRLTVLGGGRITARAVWVYLEERIGLLVARLQKGAGKLQQVMREAQEAARRRQQSQPAQRIPRQADPPPANMNNSAKGVYGEHVSDVHMQNQGHTKLNDGGTITPSTGAARGTGIDGVWRNASPPPEYIITEAKYGSSKLGDTADGRQMSDTWVTGSNRLERAVGAQEAANIRRAMRRPGGVQKQIHRIDPQGNITVNEVNRNGSVGRQLHP